MVGQTAAAVVESPHIKAAPVAGITQKGIATRDGKEVWRADD